MSGGSAPNVWKDVKDEVVQVISDKHRKDYVLLCLGYRDSAVR
jgi:hypothetical protein